MFDVSKVIPTPENVARTLKELNADAKEYFRLKNIVENPKSEAQQRFAKMQLKNVHGEDFDNDPYLGTDLSFSEPKK